MRKVDPSTESSTTTWFLLGRWRLDESAALFLPRDLRKRCRTSHGHRRIFTQKGKFRS